MVSLLRRIFKAFTRGKDSATLSRNAIAPPLLQVRELSPRQRQAVELAHGAHAAFDKEAAKLGNAMATPSGTSNIACFGGCSHCCSLYVSATPTELVLIEAYIAGLDTVSAAAIRGRIKRAHHRASGKNMLQRSVNRLPCPLLTEEGTCSVYEARPVSCRAYVSFDRSACASDERMPARDIPVPRSQTLVNMRTQIFSQLNRYEEEQGFASGSYELVQGLHTLLASSSAIGSICAGKNPLVMARTR